MPCRKKSANCELMRSAWDSLAWFNSLLSLAKRTNTRYHSEDSIVPQGNALMPLLKALSKLVISTGIDMKNIKSFLAETNLQNDPQKGVKKASKRRIVFGSKLLWRWSHDRLLESENVWPFYDSLAYLETILANNCYLNDSAEFASSFYVLQ